MKHLLLSIALLAACKKSDDGPPAPAPAPTTSPSPGSGTTVNVGRTDRLKELDTNGDGVISDEERAAGRHKRIERLRTRLDTNNDGKLTPDELKLATGRMKFDNPDELDTNKDGDVSVDELEAAMKARRAGPHGSGGSAPAPAGDE